MVGLCLGPYGGPREVGVSYERGTPVTLDGRDFGRYREAHHCQEEAHHLKGAEGGQYAHQLKDLGLLFF